MYIVQCMHIKVHTNEFLASNRNCRVKRLVICTVYTTVHIPHILYAKPQTRDRERERKREMEHD